MDGERQLEELYPDRIEVRHFPELLRDRGDESLVPEVYRHWVMVCSREDAADRRLERLDKEPTGKRIQLKRHVKAALVLADLAAHIHMRETYDQLKALFDARTDEEFPDDPYRTHSWACLGLVAAFDYNHFNGDEPEDAFINILRAHKSANAEKWPEELRYCPKVPNLNVSPNWNPFELNVRRLGKDIEEHKRRYDAAMQRYAPARPQKRPAEDNSWTTATGKRSKQNHGSGNCKAPNTGSSPNNHRQNSRNNNSRDNGNKATAAPGVKFTSQHPGQSLAQPEFGIEEVKRLFRDARLDQPGRGTDNLYPNKAYRLYGKRDAQVHGKCYGCLDLHGSHSRQPCPNTDWAKRQ
ncbi:hypothetical protein WJX73_003496 [Symbiochloris irregularis]|uniref:Uncharacterized protein n=1 Tax=Symbiochloris irregularis TaxID=706552 RepID=A0AAW1NRH9_9CHLO